MIIGLGYKARTGKDTVGSYLENMHSFNRTAFAKSLKEAVKIIYGWTDEHVNGSLKEVLDPFWEITPREVLQKFGTEACRNNLREDIWIESVGKRISEAPDEDWVITDVRFPNEAQFIHRCGGVMVRMDRDNPDAIAAGRSLHSSEIALDTYSKWDYVINNNGSFEDLYKKIDDLLLSQRLLTR